MQCIEVKERESHHISELLFRSVLHTEDGIVGKVW